MRVLIYNELDTDSILGFAKLRSALEADDFSRADVRKVGDNLFRARLNRSDRLLFSLYRYEGETCCLILEYLPNHAYERSRFLAGGADIDEQCIDALTSPEEVETKPLIYLNPDTDHFHLQDKIISFDAEQDTINEIAPPLVIVGSAGSGKTALTLEKMKQAIGDVLYVSLSPLLVRNARDLYYAHGYRNDNQAVEFLSYHDFLESIRVPSGREVTTRDFRQWFQRQRRGRDLTDPNKVYEEFRGVITGAVMQAPWLSREEYLALGIKQCIFNAEQRPNVYDLFERYLRWLEQENLYDANIVSHQYLGHIEPRYDFVVVDEVQDITNVQLYLILQSLQQSGDFVLSGDSNQIVHPNFFSWSKIKTLFFQERHLTGSGEVVRVLHQNYRNSAVVTQVANRILKLKHARFGSVDRESNYLVRCVSETTGQIQLLEDTAATKRELDRKTSRSTRVAVLVMEPDQKAEARQWFNTPLVFSVHESKGLEYDSVILYGFVSGQAEAFRAIASGVDPSALERSELPYARARDKSDKSLEIYKFYINALYVAATRAVRNIYLVESNHEHPVMRLLQLDQCTGELAVESEQSSLEEWQKEATRLERQGKDEQAQAIREQVLEQRPVPWAVMDRAEFDKMREQALAQGNKKARLPVAEYAWLHHHRDSLNALADKEFKLAKLSEDKALKEVARNRLTGYDLGQGAPILKAVDRHGLEYRNPYNQTPLMTAALLGNPSLVVRLVELGADIACRADNGFAPLHFALDQGLRSAHFAHNRLASIYRHLEPDSVAIQADGRLIKLDQRLMETFMLHLLTALFYRWLGPAVSESQAGFSAKHLAESVAHLPDDVLAARRKRREYISSILSKNEVNRDDRYNRKLFLRIKRGYYVINPALKLRIDGQWVDYYRLLRLDDLAIEPATRLPPDHPGSDWMQEKFNETAQGLVQRFRETIRARMLPENEDDAIADAVSGKARPS